METSTLCPVECPPPTTSCNRDGVCQPELAETSVVCPSDCPRSVCVADRRCDTAAGETPANCPADCTDSGMTRFCNGNGVCELELGESPDRCPRDCPRSATFTDVGGHPARTDIEGLGTLGVVAGYGDGTFRPDAFITRAEFAAIIAQAFLRARTEDVAPFTDVPNEHWASPYIARAAAAGFLHGYPDGTFRPSQRISRQEALVALASGLRMSAAAFSAVERAFTDASSTASWARDGVGRAVGAGILGNADLLAHGGGARLLRPTADATRGEIASFVFRARSLPVAEGSLTSGTGDAFVAEPDLYVFVPNASGERSEVLPVTLNDTNPTILPIRVVTISDPETASVVEGMGTSDGLRVTFDQCVSSTHWTYGAGPDSGAGPDTSALDEATVTVVSGCAACVADGQAWCPGSTTCTCVARGSMCPGEPDAEGMPTETPALVVCGDAPCAAYPSEAQCGMQPSCGWCATTGVCVARGEGGALTGCAEGDAGWLGDR